MNKIDRNKQMIEEIKSLNCKPKLLLHSCCAPCSSSVLERLVEFFDITIFFYNPNIDKEEEFKKRQDEEIRLINELNNKYSKNKIKIVTTNHNSDDYNKIVLGLENENEGGKRCEKCFFLRLSETANFAKQNNFDYFTTTLTVSPHKNAELLNEIGLKISEKFGIKFLVSDFKKEDGYKRSIELSKKYNLYRQDYCGCKFSKREKNDN